MAIFSIIIPTHNRSQLLPRAVESVIKQNVEDIEVLIVDDGSNDNTNQVVMSLMEQDARIVYKQQPTQKGAQAARNIGIKNSRGEWVAFLDSDDEFLPGCLENRLTVARNKGVSVVHSDCYIVQGDKMRVFGVPPISGNVYKETLRAPGPVFPGIIVKRSALEEIGLLDENIISYQEWDTVIRLATKFTFGFDPRPSFIYHRHTGDTISSSWLRTAQGYEQIVLKHKKDMLEYTGSVTLIKHYMNLIFFYKQARSFPNIFRCMFSVIYHVLISGINSRKMFTGCY